MTSHLKENNMKVHNSLKELLEDFTIQYIERLKSKTVITFEDFTQDYVSSNSLASVEPEPLAKNKQTESCTHHISTLVKMYGGMYCDKCKSYVRV